MFALAITGDPNWAEFVSMICLIVVAFFVAHR